MFKYEHAKFIIDRFDHYYDGVNNKGAFYIGLNTFIFGGICIGYLSLHSHVEAKIVCWVLLTGLILSNLLSIFYTVQALMPFLIDNHTNEKRYSLIYFGSIAKHELSHFKEKFKEADENSVLDDIIEQSHCLATGLQKKYSYLKRAGWFVICQFFVMFPLLVFIVKNLKP